MILSTTIIEVDILLQPGFKNVSVTNEKFCLPDNLVKSQFGQMHFLAILESQIIIVAMYSYVLLAVFVFLHTHKQHSKYDVVSLNICNAGT